MDSIYPDGYVVPKGESEHFHVMYVDIVDGGKNKIGRRVPALQKYFPKEWAQTLKVIENPVFGISITGHSEYFILHDPLAEAQAKAKAKKELADAKAEKYAKAQEEKKAKAEADAKNSGSGDGS